MHRYFSRLLLTIAASLTIVAAQAQNFPERTITVVVPLPAGGTADTLARIAAEKIRSGIFAAGRGGKPPRRSLAGWSALSRCGVPRLTATRCWWRRN